MPPLLTISELYGSLDRQPNDDQKAAIETLEGPLRIIAGPGSGKTFTLVVRTLNLVACQGVPPNEIVVVTFSESAAQELKDRVRRYAHHLPHVPAQLVELNIGTIHWFVGVVLRRMNPEFRRFEPLDDLGQDLFIYRHLDEIAGDLKPGGKYFGKWGSKSMAVGKLKSWFGKITEETLTPEILNSDSDELVQMLGVSYDRYRSLLLESGFLDFSFILRQLYDLFENDPVALGAAQQQYSHFMVDEYQDTNYVQEEVLFRLASPELNIAVVGDDDQSLYRFRGATVRNILEFPSRMADLGSPGSEEALEINYRSHPGIIRAYTSFMEDGDWTFGGREFRTGHRVTHDPNGVFPEYASAQFLAATPRELAATVADMIDRGVVEDPSQIALLFFSVSGHGAEVISALRERGIECYAPRARQFLDHAEVRDLVGAVWAVGGFSDDDDAAPSEGPVADTCSWARDCWVGLTRRAGSEPLVWFLNDFRERFEALKPGEDMSAALLDVVYECLRHAPFRSYLDDPVAARNIGHATTLLRTFQQQFGFEVLHAGNRSFLPWRLWASFFYLLDTAGVDDIETDDHVPLGMVQVMTIHQAKGLEFPVVLVGSIDRRPMSSKEIDQTLGHLYPRGQFEPESKITEYDRRRLFYVAFSRAKHLLLVHSESQPHSYFQPLVGRLPDADDVLADALRSVPTESVREGREKQSLSLTSHINVYRRCPRQYKFFREYGFAPSFAAQVFFGSVVHQTIEDIHRHVLDGRPEPLENELIDVYFARNSELLRKRGIHPLAPAQREEARRHVQRYFDANKERLDDVVDTEVEVVLEQDDYILDGRVDLIRADDGALEMVDFKAQRRTEDGPDYEQYRDQLALYWHLLEERYGQRPDRAVLYFTGEDRAEDAQVRIDLSMSDINEVVERFDGTARRIISEDFDLIEYPPRDTCRACDFQHYCLRTETDASQPA